MTQKQILEKYMKNNDDLRSALSDIIELAEYGYSGHCAADYSKKQLKAELRCLNTAKHIIKKNAL